MSFFRTWIKTFSYALKGVRELLFAEKHAGILWLSASLAVGMGFAVGLNKTEWCLVILSIGAVFSGEAMNSAVESVVDLVSPEYHPLAKKAKDLAAGAVLILVAAAALTGLLIFAPKLWLLINS